MTILLAAMPGVVSAAPEAAPGSIISHGAKPVWFRVHRGPVGESFFLASDVNIRIGSNTNATLSDLKPGEVAHVSYTVENGRWLAHEIVVNPPHGNHAGSRSSVSRTNELHTRGKILAYNVSTGNLTIKHHR